MSTPIAVGMKVKISKGCASLGVVKGSTARIRQVTEMGKDYSYSVRISLDFTSGPMAGKSISMFARHPNRLSDDSVRTNNGNPLKVVELVRA